MRNYRFSNVLLGCSFPRIIQARPHLVTMAEIANPMKNLDLIVKGGKLIDVTYKF
jgi:hypothetical protein